MSFLNDMRYAVFAIAGISLALFVLLLSYENTWTPVSILAYNGLGEKFGIGSRYIYASILGKLANQHM